MPYFVKYQLDSASLTIEPIPDATETSAGVMSAADKKKLDGLVGPSGSITLYVRPTGSNTTGDGSQSKPYATLAYALSQLALIGLGTTVRNIDVTGCNESYAGSLVVPPFISSLQSSVDMDPPTPLMNVPLAVNIYATPTVVDTLQAGDTSQTQDTNTQMLVKTTQTVGAGITTNKTYMVDQMKGKIIIGAGLGQYGVCTGNTAGPNSVLSVASTTTNFTAPIQICDPGATYQSNDGSIPMIFDEITCGVQFSGVEVLGNGNYAVLIENAPAVVFKGSHVDGIQCIGGGWNGLLNSTYVTNKYYAQQAPNCIGCFFDSLVDWAEICEPFSQLLSHCVWDNCPPIGQNSELLGFLTDGLSLIQMNRCLVTNAQSVGLAHGGAPMVMNRVTLNDGADDAIFAQGPGGRLTLSRVIGTGNAGYGLHADDGDHVQVDGNTNVTGEGGDLLVGGMGGRTWVDFRGMAPTKNQFDVPGFTGVTTPDTCTGARVWQP